MAIKKAELRPKLPNGTYDDVVYLKTSIDMVEGLNIKNNLTETIEGSVLDATQGKILNEKIGDTAQLQTNDKTSLVNAINELKSTGGTGGVVSALTVFDVDDYEVFTATAQTNTFNIQNMSENKIVQIVYSGLELIKDVNYTINKLTGTVTLGFNLEKGESIYYKTLYSADTAVIYDESETIEGSVSFDADTLQGNSANSFVKKAQIKNTLTETVTGNVLDARQGKVLNDRVEVLERLQNGVTMYTSLSDISPELTTDSTMIDVVSSMSNNSILVARYPNALVGEQNLPFTSGILTIVKGNSDRTTLTFQKAWDGIPIVWNGCVNIANTNYKFSGWQQVATTQTLDDRGYLTSKMLTSIDLNTIVLNGTYSCMSCTNRPNINNIDTNIGMMVVVQFNHGNRVRQIYYNEWGSSFERNMLNDGSWTSWQIASFNTRKALTSDCLRNGFTFRSGYEQWLVKNGNTCTLIACLNCTNASAGTVLLMLPSGYRPKYYCGDGSVFGTTSNTCLIELTTAGEVRLWDGSAAMTNSGCIWLNITYEVEG